jgi:hypothetical protein
MPALLNLILAHFPDYAEKIRILYLADDEFKSLCEDFLTSKMALEKSTGKISNDQQLESEYRQLMVELEKEIINYIKKKL